MTIRSAESLRSDVEQIWLAGMHAVLPAKLVPEHVLVDGTWLTLEADALDLDAVERIAIVGGGKAAGAMATALEKVLGPQLLTSKRVVGWVNVPADCVAEATCVKLHPARPAGLNEPCREGVEGTRRILEIVSSLGSRDLCFCLLSGGGSALLPAPVPDIPLAEKVRLIQLISGAGGAIEELNTVRSQLSLIKAGGLLRACRAGRLVTLVISDVLGDPLDLIASGPTTESSATAADALGVLNKLGLEDEPQIGNIVQYLRRRTSEPAALRKAATTVATTLILANNATAVDAAGVEAEKLGYSHAMISAARSEGAAEDVGQHLAQLAVRMRDGGGPDCLISGGEPTVKLAPVEVRGRGGRNQQLALAALQALGDARDVALLAAGTDGEDGPTDAAGAFVTSQVVRAAREAGLDPAAYLAHNDAYSFFQRCGGLFVTGPTQTNVCDLRVIAVRQAGGAQSHHH